MLTSCRRASDRHDMPPPRPATEARSGSLEPGRPSRARSANTRRPASRPHTPPADQMYATDRCDMSDSIIALRPLGGGTVINGSCSDIFVSLILLICHFIMPHAIIHYYAALLPRRGRILRRTLSVCPSVCLSVPLADVLCLQLHRLTSEHPK